MVSRHEVVVADCPFPRREPLALGVEGGTGRAVYRRANDTRAKGRRTPALSLSMCHCQVSVGPS